jgi:hypothetical protein
LQSGNQIDSSPLGVAAKRRNGNYAKYRAKWNEGLGKDVCDSHKKLVENKPCPKVAGVRKLSQKEMIMTQ